MAWFLTIVGGLVAYFLGSFPTSYLVGKIVKGIDIRQHGSGNVGATNVARVIGKWPGLVVLLVDIGKGWVAVRIGVATPFGVLSPVFGLCAVCGHIWSPFLGFKGGKGVATATGVLLGLSPGLAAAAAAIWGATAAITRYVSVSSIVAVTAVPFLMVATNRPVSWVTVSVILCVLIVAKHRANIGRLLNRAEHRISVRPSS